jgi:hypothetical protein
MRQQPSDGYCTDECNENQSPADCDNSIDQRFILAAVCLAADTPPWREDRFEDTWGLSLTESVTFVSIGLVLEHRFDLLAQFRRVLMPVRGDGMLHRFVEDFCFRTGYFERAIFLARIISAID